MLKSITKQDLLNKVTDLLKEYEVIGGKELPNKGVFYGNISQAKDLYLGSEFVIEPVKKFFLTPAECLADEILSSQGVVMNEVKPSEKKRVIIGARHCEVRGLVLLDKVFHGPTALTMNTEPSRSIQPEYKDNFYIQNRNRTIIIGLACNKPDKACFCTSLGGSPAETRGMDALLYETEGGFILDIVTDKGKEIMGSLGQDLKEDKVKAFNAEKDKIKNAVKTEVKIPEPNVLDATFAADYWNKASLSCLSCGICTYLCPSCHCFDLVDEDRKKLRCYDGCAFADFTLETSGENPRPTKKERYRQRAFHKFDFFKKNFGENLCVGCGRCIRSCPVKINIAEVIENAVK